MPRTGAQMVVEAVRDPVESVAVRAVHPGCRVPLARGETDLPGKQEFPAAQQARPGAVVLGHVPVVAAPRDVDGPGLAVREVAAGLGGVQHEGGVQAGPAAPVLPCVGADAEIPALDLAFHAPAAGEVEQLRGVRRHGQVQRELVERELGAVVAEFTAHPDQPRLQHLQAEDQPEPALPVDGGDVHGRRTRFRVVPDWRAVHGDGGAGERRGPVAALP